MYCKFIHLVVSFLLFTSNYILSTNNFQRQMTWFLQLLLLLNFYFLLYQKWIISCDNYRYQLISKHFWSYHAALASVTVKKPFCLSVLPPVIICLSCVHFSTMACFMHRLWFLLCQLRTMTCSLRNT